MRLTNAIRRPELTDVAEEFSLQQTQTDFIGQQLMPIFVVQETSGQYPFLPMENFLKIRETKRAPRTGSSRGEFEFTMKPFTTEEHQAEEAVDDTEVVLYKNYFEVERLATERSMDAILRRYEKQVADTVMDEANAGKVKTLTKPWSDSTSDPRTDFRAILKEMRYDRLIAPNIMVIHDDVLDVLLEHPKLVDYLKFTQPHLVEGRAAQLSMLATYFGVPTILSPKSIYDPTSEGKKTVITDIWSSNYVSLLRVDNSPNLQRPQFGRTFMWAKRSGTGGTGNIIVESYREEAIQSTVIRCRRWVKPNVIAKQANYLIKNLVA
jgi:hypothetical protein